MPKLIKLGRIYQRRDLPNNSEIKATTVLLSTLQTDKDTCEQGAQN